MIPLFLSLALTVTSAPDWSTVYEKSGYVETGRYPEAVDYCHRLERASPFARVIRFGVSPEGRPLIALVISRDRAFTPDAAMRSGKPLIFIDNGIHSGEIEGKDASLILAREILITKCEAALIDRVNLLIVPVFSVDAHERFRAYNRINQNGPQEMGWRATAVNLNLNRDFIKADATEMQGMLHLLHTWKPDFFFDNHTTDGGDWRYSVQIGVCTGPDVAAPVADWSRAMVAAIQPQVERDGYLMAPYFGGFDPAHPERGLSVDTFGPRYSHGYLAAMNRPAMLVETHMLKPYRHRVETTYSLVKRTIEYCGQNASGLKAAIAAADQADATLTPGTPMTLTAKTGTQSHPFVFKGWTYKPYMSAVSGAMIPAWTHEPQDIPTTIRDTFEPALTLDAPAAYAVPPQWSDAIALLEQHGLSVVRTSKPVSDTFETFRFENARWARGPFESRFQPDFTTMKIQERRTLPEGTVIVRAAQPGARLLMHLLEPDAPDSLIRWGIFNTIFEQKEYFEDYAMEPIARKMLEQDPTLRAEFETKLKEPAFAASPRARLDFFYERSPYADEKLNKYPIVRLTAAQLAAATANARSK